MKKIFILSIILCILAGAGCNSADILINKPASSSFPRSSSTSQPAPAQHESSSSTDLKVIFDLKNKSPDAKLFYSDKLGIGFTYTPFSPDDHYHLSNDEVVVTEQGNKILIGYQGQKEFYYEIEIFTKDSSLTLEQAISKQFLINYSPKECFVKKYSMQSASDSAEINFAPPSSTKYVTAGISFPRKNDPSYDEPWWESSKCPKNYSESNVVKYFMMNPAIPNKFIFVKDGNLSITSDGAGADWSNSIRIIK
jgi:hypothetical protein